MYNLNEVEKNHLSILDYVMSAMRAQNFTELEIHRYINEATKSDFEALVKISEEMINDCNKRIKE